MKKCFSVVYWKDLSTEALSTCFGLLKAKVNDYLNCNDAVQCVHVSSYLFTMMTLFCLSTLCCHSTYCWTCSFIFVVLFFFSFFALIKTKHGLSINVVLIIKQNVCFRVHQSTSQEGSYYLYHFIFYGFIDITCHVFHCATCTDILVLFICYLSSIHTKTVKKYC